MNTRAQTIGIPNIISALRFPLAVLFPLIDDLAARAAVVLVAAASDWVDGRIARGTRQVTRTGELLDPVADKTFMLAVLGTLVLEHRLPAWTLPLLLVRDIGVAAGAMVLAARRVSVRMSARRPGKIVTWLQFAGIGIVLLRPEAAAWVAVPLAAVGIYALHDYARAVLRPQP